MTLFLKTKQGYAKRSTLIKKKKKKEPHGLLKNGFTVQIHELFNPVQKKKLKKKWLHNENQEVESTSFKILFPNHLRYQT